MQKLKSLETFKNEKLNVTHTSFIIGGQLENTGAGETCSSATSTGCMGYRSDTYNTNTGGYTYKNFFEVAKACEDERQP